MLSKIKTNIKICTITFFFLPLLGFSQPIKRCGTYEYWEEMKRKNPSLAITEEKTRRDANAWIASHALMRTDDALITIPVVVHVLYHASEENISDKQVLSQIDVLNEDFQKLNTDIIYIPAAWNSLAANMQLQFCLASVAPDGSPTSGIERRYTAVTAWDIADLDSMKHFSAGGLDVWNRDHYLNIWVGKMTGSVLGITQLPGGPPETDGMCILYSAFGRTGKVRAPYNKGRTATHETGHWLGLYHVWGDDGGACSGTDFINDTPNQADATYGHPAFPRTDVCSPNFPGIMFMNYMDYSDDDVMHLFTNDQSLIMKGVLHTSRDSILHANTCTIGPAKEFIRVYYPAPGSIVEIRVSFDTPSSLEITITDLLGRPVRHKIEDPATQALYNLNVEMNMATVSNGIYILGLKSPTVSLTRRIIIQH